MRKVSVAQHRKQLVVERPADARDDIRKNDPIGPAGDRDARERVGMPDELGARTVHGAQPGAAGEHSVPSISKRMSLRTVQTFFCRALRSSLKDCGAVLAIDNPMQEASE